MKNEYDRWIAKVDKNTGTDCWLWTGTTYRRGYGHFRRWINGKWKMEKAHRYSYEIHHGVSRHDLEGWLVCHSCDVTNCVNPDHLWLGTTAENIRDKIKKKRGNFGIKSGCNALSFNIATNIREYKMAHPWVTYEELGKLFKTSASQAHRIITNKIWKILSKEMIKFAA